MDDQTAALAVLPTPALERFRLICEANGPLEPRFEGYTKHVLLTEDRAFLFPRNHTIAGQLERECAVYATVDHPLVPRLLGRWHEQRISPYPFFAVTRLAGRAPTRISPENLPPLAAQLGAAIAACHDTRMDLVPRSLWANPWQEPPPAPPTAIDCYSPLRYLGGAENLAESAASFTGAASSAALLEALRAAEALAPVLAHGDLHEGQILVDESGGLTGILDWGFGGVLSPLVDFTCSWRSELFAAEASYGEIRRHMWAAYAGHRSAPLPTWEQVQLALTAFDITALAPETASHYYWQESAEWQATRRAAAGDCLLARRGSRWQTGRAGQRSVDHLVHLPLGGGREQPGDVPGEGLEPGVAGDGADLRLQRGQVGRLLLEDQVGRPERGEVAAQDARPAPAGGGDQVAQRLELLLGLVRPPGLGGEGEP